MQNVAPFAFDKSSVAFRVLLQLLFTYIVAMGALNDRSVSVGVFGTIRVDDVVVGAVAGRSAAVCLSSERYCECCFLDCSCFRVFFCECSNLGLFL